MSKQAVCFREGDWQASAAEALIARLAASGFTVAEAPAPADPGEILRALPDGPAVMALPMITEDCRAVKLTQIARTHPAPRAILLYCQSLPSPEQMCLAFREGADDVVAAEAGPDALAVQVARAERLLRKRRARFDEPAELRHKLETMQQTCEQLERQCARWHERVLSLAVAASRIARGELQLGAYQPELLIVSASATQAASAAKLAEGLGFAVRRAADGAEGLSALAQRPANAILTDCTLPDTTAAQLARSARQTLGARPVMVIAWSSDPDAEDAVMTPESGIDDFVPKSATGEATGLLAAALFGALR
jgi:DNA-binding response OmpR family regulator